MTFPAWMMITSAEVALPTTASMVRQSPFSLGMHSSPKPSPPYRAPPPNRRYATTALIKELAHASGSLGLIAGQVLDLDSEKKRIPLKKLVEIHRAKTGALITTSLRLGAMSAGARPNQLRSLTQFGQALGLAFQVIDDILDITSTKEKLGKSIGKDQSSGKATYPRLLGLAGAKKEADRLTNTARSALRPLGSAAAPLLAIADTLLCRDH